MPEKENPTIEEPTENPVDEAQSLMEELKKLDIQTPKDIQNMAYASQETGKAWNEVGALRKEVERLKSEVATPATPEYYDNSESVDLGKVVEDKVQGVLNNYLANQQRAQQMSMQVMSEVRNDPEYNVVGEVFEKYINSPDAMMRLQTGQTDYKTEYLNTKAAYYRNLAQRSSKTLEGLMDKKTVVPHIEQGDSQSTPALQADDEKAQDFKKIKQAQKDGSLSSEETLDKIVKSVMPDAKIDPSFFLP